ncbi:MAG: hypothetical protein E7593_02605, partial [Ruminococcaceae bacterium]|nr:hypothetical protein [Oscillospiraceae bacterium]
MKKLLLIIFSVLICIALASCGAGSDNPQNELTETKDNDNSPTKDEVISTLTDTDEKREYVVNYIRDMANIEWTPEKTFILYGKYQAWSYNLTYEKGKTYYGLPFLVDSRGTKQEFLNSVVDGVYVGPTSGSNCIGDACYDAVYVTLIQVCPSITFKSTEDMLPKNETGLKAVGEWNWEASKHDTPTIINKNSLEVMAKAY